MKKYTKKHQIREQKRKRQKLEKKMINYFRQKKEVVVYYDGGKTAKGKIRSHYKNTILLDITDETDCDLRMIFCDNWTKVKLV